MKKFDFKNLSYAIEVFERFFDVYNNHRYLTCLLDLPPTIFISKWHQGLIGLKEIKNKFKFFFKEDGNYIFKYFGFTGYYKQVSLFY